MSTGPFLAIDWGTTNRRIFRIAGDTVEASASDAWGVTAVDDYPAALRDIRSRFGDLPVLMAGMVGSTIGWREAGYVPAPAGLPDLSAALLRIDERTAIVPGVSFVSGARGDVMRGEEVQLLGAVADGVAPGGALLVQPGTHCKWVEMAGGRIARFVTAMTGELFGLIARHSILASQLGGTARMGDSFLAGVAEGAKRDVAASLFAIRSATLLDLPAAADAASFASGIVIGADVAARIAAIDFDRAYVVADGTLGPLYAAAIEAQGRSASVVDGRTAFIAGISRIAEGFL